MATPSTALWLLAQEARALLTRLTRVRPLALHEPMVPAAGISSIAQTTIERYLAEGRRELRERVHALRPPKHSATSPSCGLSSILCLPSSTCLLMC
jgi:hypothetical protein